MLNVGCSRALIAVDPAAYLTLHVPVGSAYRVKTGRPPIDGVQVDEDAHERFGDGPMKVCVGLPVRGKFLVEDYSAAALHDVERRANHVHVFAQDERPRSERKHRMKSLQDVELASHVV